MVVYDGCVECLQRYEAWRLALQPFGHSMFQQDQESNSRLRWFEYRIEFILFIASQKSQKLQITLSKYNEINLKEQSLNKPYINKFYIFGDNN